MEKVIKDIAKSAVGQGACSLVKNVGDFKELSELFFSTQGLEFCTENDFPSIDYFRELKRYGVEKYDVFIDAGKLTKVPSEHIAFVGDTAADIYCRGSKHIFHIVLAHGAKAIVRADSYAVIKIYEIGDCDYSLDIDKTVVLL